MSEVNDNETTWFFAIGSLTHPKVLEVRKFESLESRPAELLDHKLCFYGPFGFAEARPEEGESIHGVVHKAQRDQTALDQADSGFVRRTAKARSYGDVGEELEVTVYVCPDMIERASEVDKPPQEYYIQTMVQGLTHYGVKDSFIESLQNLDCCPRPKPGDFLSFPAPPTNTAALTLAEVEAADGSAESIPIYVTINGKVLECSLDRNSLSYRMIVGLVKQFGHHLEMYFSQVYFDSHYGIPASLVEFSREHAANCEDTACRHEKENFEGKAWKVIAPFEQTYKD